MKKADCYESAFFFYDIIAIFIVFRQGSNLTKSVIRSINLNQLLFVPTCIFLR